MKRLIAVSLLTTVMTVTTSIGFVNKASADDDAKINARIEIGGRKCKDRVASKMGSSVSMADITVELGATLKQSIDAGEMSLSDIEKSGLSYNWEVSKKKASGYCNTNGKGEVVKFESAN